MSFISPPQGSFNKEKQEIDSLTEETSLDDSSEEEASFSSKEFPQITWKTHQYATKEPFHKRFCCVSSDLSFDAPLTDKVTFERNFGALLPFMFEKEFDENLGLDSNDFTHATRRKPADTIFTEQGLRTTTIPERIFEASQTINAEFLQPFVNCYNVQTFLANYNNLSPKDQKRLIKIIGGRDVFQIVLDLAEKIKKLSEIAKLIKIVETNQIPLDENDFTKFTLKIEAVDEKQVKGSFRCFQAKKFFNTRGNIFINGSPLKLPNLTTVTRDYNIHVSTEELITEEEAFSKWLCESISSKLSADKKLVDFIVRCLSISAFHFAALAHRKAFPSLYQVKDNIPKWKLNSAIPTRYYISREDKDSIESEEEEQKDSQVTITQVKSYSLQIAPSDETAELYDIGSMNVHWQVTIDSKRNLLDKRLSISTLVFFENTDLDTQLDVLRQMANPVK